MEREQTMSSVPLDGPSASGQRARPGHGRTTGPTRRSTKGQWTTEEDEILRKAVERFKGKNWKKIAECFKDRTDVQCLHRWQKVLNPDLVKGPWSKEEDSTIVEMVEKYGPKKWSMIAQHLPGRIGKQCRERWHNHLNPSINKEAWTQEEELALIRAHQLYGNKWAELSKFLPGRTDNAIKNHWNSSVKKKLDSYIASGLLAQFPELPPFGYQNQFVPSASRMQSSGDDNAMRGVTETEEISDCSQGSAFVGCSQSGADDMVLQRSEDLQLVEESTYRIAQNSTHYYPTTEEATVPIPDVHPDISCPSNPQVQHFPSEDGICRDQSYQFNSNDLTHISLLELAQGSLGFTPQGTNQRHDHLSSPFPSSTGALVASSAGNLAVDNNQVQHIFISDEECCRILFSETANSGGNSSENHVKEEYRYQSSNIAVADCSRGLSEPYDDSRLEVLDGSAELCYMVSPMQNQPNANQEIPHNGFVCNNEFATSSYDGDTIGTMESLDMPEDNSSLVSVGNLQSTSVSMPTYSLVKAESKMMKEESGSLCYEPPRFPSLDMPFLSCDLIQSSNDTQIDYSPLGIRQLMMSSMNCISPFRLWDSPSHDSSPEGVLKSAAKTFTNPPSILRKRNRDLLSPLSDRRMDKRLEMDIASNLSRDFSRLDVVVGESTAGKTPVASSLDDKENMGNTLVGGQESGVQAANSDRGHKPNSCNENLEQRIADTDASVKEDDSKDPQSMEQPTDNVLTEHDVNDLLLFSPTQPNQKTERMSAVGDCGTLGSPGNSCQAVSSPAVRLITCGSSQKKRASGSKLALHTSTPLEIVVDKGPSDYGAENLSIFGGTPFKRSLESPSAWKSPWFMNSFLPGPRIETEITIEDIGYFMSPGEKSYDALGLMKHLSEHSAAAFANAQEVLGIDTPVTVKDGSSDENRAQEDQDPNQQPTGGSSSLASNILIERRALDFSECGSPSPGKSKEQGRVNNHISSGVSFSSPSSYLLKGCR